MPVLPFHRYIGPGNDINSGPCVDADDCIAQKHDIKYENAKTPQDVRLADVEAIKEFRTNWMSGNWHSLIGDIGLSLKYCVETYTGVIYPKLGNYEPCEIIPLFHDIIKLHCVNKERLVNRYSQIIRAGQTEQSHELTRRKRSNQSYENFFYILVIWYQLYCNSKEKSKKKNSDGKSSINKPTLAKNELDDMFHYVASRKLKYIPFRNTSSSLVQNCDIFNLKAWITFFSRTHPNQQAQSSDYNDEEFSNIFMLYD